MPNLTVVSTIFWKCILGNLSIVSTLFSNGTSNRSLQVPLRRKFVGLFRPNSVAEYRVVSILAQKTEQETVHLNIF